MNGPVHAFRDRDGLHKAVSLSAAGLTLHDSGGDSGRRAGAVSLSRFGCLELPAPAAVVALEQL